MSETTTEHRSDAPIDLRNVTKTYGRGRRAVRALRGVDMRVEPGEVFGLLGPNGAGKSTLVKVIMTVIHPGRCEGSVLGRPVGVAGALRRVGYLPEHHRFPPYRTAMQVLHFSGAMFGMPRRERVARGSEILDRVGMADWAKDRVGTFSKGMRQRLGIAQALLHDPEIVLLDEPTDGVDPVGRKDIRQIVEGLRDKGKTVLLNSHLHSELELVCSRVANMVRGEMAAQGTLDDLTRDTRRYRITLAAPPDESLVSRVRGLASAAEFHDATIVLPSDNAEHAQPVLREVLSARSIVVSAGPVRPSLEDLFIQAVQNAPGVGGREQGQLPTKGPEVTR